MQAGNDLVNVVKQYNEFALKKAGIGLRHRAALRH